jgi:plastocyanin
MTADDAFKPKSISLVVGTSVRWRNRSKDEHSVSDDPHAASDEKDVSLPTAVQPFN